MAGIPANMVIVGGGSAGWMAASILLHIMGRKGTRVTLIESSNVPTIGVGEGTVPLFRRFLEFLGITEAEFMQACHATYKHGINFPGWTGNDEFATYFHPFNTPAFASYEGDFFDHCNRRRRGEVIDTDPAGYFFNAELARQRKAPAGPPPADPRQVGYAYHFDAGLLAEFLKQRALRLGINHIIDDVTGVVTGENGTISHLVTAGHGNIIADFFIDCTGFARRLIGKCLGTDHLSYRPRMFNDSAVVMRSPLPPGEDIPPFTESRALRCGWAWRIPLTSRIGWGYVYSSDYTSAEDAETELRRLVGEAGRDQPVRQLKMQVGRQVEHWKSNCVAIGLSQGFIEPLEATALGLTQFTINRFMAYFHEGNFTSGLAAEFNKVINEAFDSTLDYIQMHYLLNTRDDTQYWRDNRMNQNLSDTMRAALAGWDDPARDFSEVIGNYVKGSYSPYSWYCILSGMGRYAGKTLGQASTVNSNPYTPVVGRYYGHREYLERVLQQAPATG